MKLKYRDKDYFNENDYYVFTHHDDTHPFVSKVEHSRGFWWTVRSLQFKATTIRCKLVKR